MPQLNPGPWLAYLLFSWLVLTVVVMPKVLARTLPKNPTPKPKHEKLTEPWHWPWY